MSKLGICAQEEQGNLEKESALYLQITFTVSVFSVQILSLLCCLNVVSHEMMNVSKAISTVELRAIRVNSNRSLHNIIRLLLSAVSFQSLLCLSGGNDSCASTRVTAIHKLTGAQHRTTCRQTEVSWRPGVRGQMVSSGLFSKRSRPLLMSLWA